MKTFNQKLPTEKTSPLKNEIAGFKKVAAGPVNSKAPGGHNQANKPKGK